MRIKSAYISKKEANQEFDAITAPNATSKTNLDMSSNNIIDNIKQKINHSDENSSKDPPKKRFALPETDSEGNKLTSELLKKELISQRINGMQICIKGNNALSIALDGAGAKKCP